PGVRAVLSCENAPKLHEAVPELQVLQSPRVAYRGQVVGLVVADSLEAARHAARLVRVQYAAEAHDVVLHADHATLYAPPTVNPSYDTDTEEGDFDGAFAAAQLTVDATYQTPPSHNNAMEPHASLAAWRDGALTIYDSTQGAAAARDTVARAF